MLNGSIPACIGNQSSLRYLNLRSSNNLSSTIPTTLWSLTYVLEVYLHSSSLSGSRSSEIESLKVLNVVDLSGNQLSVSRLNIVEDIAMALEYLHQGNSTPIVHCDLKPSNILLDEDMVAHVGDFGIAKLLGGGEAMRQTMTLATIGYMAPECGSKGIVSTRWDVYAFEDSTEDPINMSDDLIMLQKFKKNDVEGYQSRA
ncbi:LRR receptor-like serine/threonine-protein kinase EFR [Tripterygium wilfordii]|uniref:LRR receptor-like serine/threonine-protein kinase EFR n=1 Tax=Tripterygium wilfordii TaxID=458696 RepID=UPI0018F7EEC3|nr:LRR receptor-like serine/threonine-protein kinase EFR [Tripterygium wilfordii]